MDLQNYASADFANLHAVIALHSGPAIYHSFFLYPNPSISMYRHCRYSLIVILPIRAHRGIHMVITYIPRS